MSDNIELGDIARDKITGFTGVVIAKTSWLHGCNRFTLCPRGLKDGKPIDSHSFDEPQLSVVSRGEFTQHRETGGPRPEPVLGRG